MTGAKGTTPLKQTKVASSLGPLFTDSSLKRVPPKAPI